MYVYIHTVLRVDQNVPMSSVFIHAFVGDRVKYNKKKKKTTILFGSNGGGDRTKVTAAPPRHKRSEYCDSTKHKTFRKIRRRYTFHCKIILPYYQCGRREPICVI